MKIPVRHIATVLTFLFFVTSGITWTADSNRGGLSGRATVADLIGVFILLVAIVIIFARRRIAMPNQFRAYLPLLAVLFVGVLFAHDVARGMMELLVHIFVFFVAVALVNIHAKQWDQSFVESLLKMILWSGAALASVGLAAFLFFPSLFPGVDSGLSGTFRNTGQAGAFFGVYFALVVPALLAGLLRQSKLNVALVFLIALALLFTVKRAALVGAIIGMLLLALSLAISTSKRDKKYGLVGLGVLGLLVPILYLAFNLVREAIPGFAWRFGYKINVSVVDDFSQGFFVDNLEAAKTAFAASPLIGAGLGNVGGIITEQFEIHSTYLAILGNTGLLGLVTYAFFMGYLLRSMMRADRSNSCGRFVSYFIPMFVGLAVSWSYTYHLRKREFWIMMFVVTVAVVVSRECRRRRGIGCTPEGSTGRRAEDWLIKSSELRQGSEGVLK